MSYKIVSFVSCEGMKNIRLVQNLIGNVCWNFYDTDVIIVTSASINIRTTYDISFLIACVLNADKPLSKFNETHLQLYMYSW